MVGIFLDKPIYTYPANSSFAGSALINEYGEVLGIGSLYVGDAAATGISSLEICLCQSMI